MEISHLEDVEPVPAEKAGITGAERLAVRPLVAGPRVSGVPTLAMVLLELEPGGSTPEHHHLREEEIFVKTGSGILRYSGEDIPLRPGHAIYLGPNETHQFLNTGKKSLELLCITRIQNE